MASQPLAAALAAAKIEILAFSAPKQTETVQRWQISLRARGLEIPSKIEFSRRGIDRTGTEFSPIDPHVLAEHRLTPTFLARYEIRHALTQKVEALAGRSETQARDIDDLGHLFSRAKGLLPLGPAQTVAKAIECAMSVDLDQFRGQVWEFLDGDSRAYYSEASSWEKLQTQVIMALEGK